jgi:hypothetical protein
MRGRQVERRPGGADHAIDGDRGAAADKAVPPFSPFLTGDHDDWLGEDRRRQILQRPDGVIAASATGLQVHAVGPERGLDGHWRVRILFRAIAADELASGDKRLRIGEDTLVVGRLEVVGDAEFLQPFPATPVVGANRPSAGGCVAPVAKR